MAAPKHRADATQRIDDLIYSLPDWSRKICIRLRALALGSDTKMIEDWKWAPNYNLEGMVCGFMPTKKHVNLVFFKGTQMKDKRKLFVGDPDNLNIRTLRFTSEKDINDEIILEYIMEAIDLNRRGIKAVRTSNKEIVVPPYIKKGFKKAGVLTYFESLPYSHRREYIRYIEDAKKEETRVARVEKAVSKLLDKAKISIIKKKK
ncbi:MAG: hypothetical protein K0S32_1006 [Bacteroidetes bacterium]|jgi:hypothetical protein|nr:hypothetical protein [Bacteroidota bacterium]